MNIPVGQVGRENQKEDIFICVYRYFWTKLFKAVDPHEMYALFFPVLSLGVGGGGKGGRVKSCLMAPKVLRSRSPWKVFKARRVFRYLLRNSLWYVAGPFYWNDALARYRTVCMIPGLDLLTNRFHSAVHGPQSHHRRAPQHLHSFRDVWDVVF